VRNLAFTDRPNLVGWSSNNRCGLNGERYKLYLVGFLPRIYVNDNPDITRFKPVIWKSNRKNHSVMFTNHYCNDSSG
jgi:hypothetical protein